MSADGSRVLFRTDLNQNRPQLFVVDIATPTTVTPVDNSDFKGLFHVNDDYRMSADGSVVIYSGSDSFNSESMWMAPLAGPTIDSTLLADTPDGFNTTVRETLAVSPDGKRVFFRQDVSQGFTGLFVVELATPEVVTPVYDAETLEIDADNLALSPDGNHLVFGANGDGGEGGFQNPGTSGNGSSSISTELYAIDLTQTLPATPVRIATDDVKSDGIESDYIPLDDGRVILRGDLDTPGAAEVYIGSPAAPDTVTKISPPLGLVNATRVAAMNRFR
jgi:Tol biopolymer transport system component